MRFCRLRSSAPLLAVLFIAFVRLRTTIASHDADTTYPLRLANDLIHTSIRGWVVAPTPYFFPDTAVTLAASAVVGSLFAYGFYSVCMTLAMYAVMARINRAVAPGLSVWSCRMASAATIWLIAIPRVSRVALSVDLFRSLMSPAVHGGAAVIALWVVLYTHTTLVRGRWSITRLVVLVVVMFAACASDALALAHSFFPVVYLAGASALNRWVERGMRRSDTRARARAIGWTVVYLSSSVAGLLSYRLLPYVGAVRFQGEGPRLGIAGLLRASANLAWGIVEHPAWAVSVGLCVLAFRVRRSADSGPLQPIAVALALMGGSAFFTTGALGFSQPADARRMLLVYVVPLMFAPVLAIRVLALTPAKRGLHRLPLLGRTGAGGLLPRFVFVGLVGVSLGVGLGAGLRLKGTSKVGSSSTSPQVVRCIDDLRDSGTVHAGLLSFWNAGELDLLSRTDAPTVAIDVDARAWFALRNVSNLLAMDARARVAGEPVDYVVTQHVHADSIRSAFGAPSEVRNCAGGAAVWLYPPQQLQPALRRFRLEAQQTLSR